MINYLFQFSNEDAAKSDPILGLYCEDGVWRGDVCIPNVTVQNDADDRIAGWFIRIAFDEPDAYLASRTYLVPDRYIASPVFA